MGSPRSTAAGRAGFTPRTCGTGIASQNRLLQRLSLELSRAVRRNRPTAVVVADLDHLKSINDTYGRAAGDEVLRQTAVRIGASVRGRDMFGRYGGEEFLIVLHRCNRVIGAALAERIRERVTAVPVAIAGFHISLSLSLGVAATRGREQLEPGTLIGAADAALYRAKAEGRNRVAIATSCEATAGRCSM